MCPLVPGEFSYHNASTPLFDVVETLQSHPESGGRFYQHSGPQTRSEVPEEHKWPVTCACGYAFQETDHWQVFADHLYRRSDTGEIVTLTEAPPGAMWNAEHLNNWPAMTGPDGLSLTVKCPNGLEWLIDGPCNNCTAPGTDHKCWCRTGEVPIITVDKNCNTCSAGAGSIQAGDYHGFLKAGVFEP
jgi:hypothetical protein